MSEATEILVFAEVDARSPGMLHFEHFCSDRKCPRPRWHQAGVWHPDLLAVVFVIACVGYERVRGEGMMWHLSLSCSRLPVPIHTGNLPVLERWLPKAGRSLLAGVSLEIDRAESKPHCIHAFGQPVERER